MFVLKITSENVEFMYKSNRNYNFINFYLYVNGKYSNIFQTIFREARERKKSGSWQNNMISN